MVITDRRIRQLVETVHLISPFNDGHLQSESYDVTVGSKITIMKKEIQCLDVNDQSGIDSCYEDLDIPDDGYVVSPKQYVLVSLLETITIPENITAHLRPRTTCTRLGLIVAAQHCNSTYSGQLRIGVFNATDYPIRIRKGISIAQIVFEELDTVPSPEKQYKNRKNAHYQNENSTFRGSKFTDSELDAVWIQMLK